MEEFKHEESPSVTVRSSTGALRSKVKLTQLSEDIKTKEEIIKEEGIKGLLKLAKHLPGDSANSTIETIAHEFFEEEGFPTLETQDFLQKLFSYTTNRLKEYYKEEEVNHAIDSYLLEEYGINMQQ